jgi:hypothetical protein
VVLFWTTFGTGNADPETRKYRENLGFIANLVVTSLVTIFMLASEKESK